MLPQARMSTATILIVDDRVENRDFLATLLGYKGYRLLVARDGAEALELAHAEHPDLVITDVLMPTMDGYEFVRRLRAEPATAQIAVVFYTAHFRGPEAEELAEACGVQNILVKPCEPELILRTVEQVLSAITKSLPPPASEFGERHLRLITDKLSETANALKLTNARLTALIDIDLQLASERDPRRLLEMVCRAARDLIGAKHAMLAIGKRDDGGEAEFVATSGMGGDSVYELGRPLLNHGVVGSSNIQRKSLRMRNPDGDPVAVGLPDTHPPVHTLLVAPIVSLAHVYGWVCLSDKLGADEFSAEDERLLGILAAQAGRIYENGSLYMEIRQHAELLQVEVTERKRAVEELSESELRFRQLAENINEAFFLIDPRSGQLLYVSPAFETIYGRSCASILAAPRSWLELVHSDDRERAMAIFDTRNARRPSDHEYRIVRPDGVVRWIRMRSFPIHSAGRRIYRVAGVAADITEVRNQQEKIKRLTRIKEVRSGINSAVVRIRDRNELLEEACRVAVEVGLFKLAWIGSIDPDTSDGRIVAWSGGSEAYIDEVRLTAKPDSPYQDRPINRAVRELRPIVCNDLRLDPTVAPVKAELIRRGHRAMAAFPLVVQERVHVLTLFAGEIDFFDREEIELLQELVGDIAFGLEHIAKGEKLDYVSNYDALTGLPNRMLFNESLKWTISQAVEHRWTVSVMLVDLDRFKNINDTLGHALGDELLLQVSQRLTGWLEIRETVWRLGGDEFALVLVSTEGQQGSAVDVANSIHDALHKPFLLDGREVAITASIGISVFPTDSSDPDTLLKYADTAMYKAKEAGQDTFRFYRAEMNALALEQLELDNALRKALSQGEFELYYQPKVRTDNGRWSGVEALLRWNRPEHGLVLPSIFIPIIEGTRLAVPVSAWVIDTACRQISQWRQSGIGPFRMAVNVSGKSFVLDALPDLIASALQEHSVDPSLLEIEITESSLMVPVDETDTVLHKLKALGIGISMDDFGTGYSNLAYLKRFPIDTLKIDMSFIRDITVKPDAAAIAIAVIEMAQSLKLKVVAEGVETRAQYDLLSANGCDEIQGFYISRPLPAAELETLYRTTQTADAFGAV
ncbi:EAL domain-containing protein [Lysobacter sp. CFH 32150]|uniref:EAL domain-containing protein n=1 Tax=Lysobacter sp. CFH 32150 TaxID=2927128 RepID=UPI001FA740CB|nr:EAL domain-containing protein [Lysobacter sp. CFH 32150]MCI4569440.1 EAL domain-containing protein [Lysobacter sp. CFH 32150]